MAITTEIKDQEFFSEIINSEKFLSQRDNNTTNLAALVMERIKVETTVTVSVGFILTINEIVESFVGNTLTLRRTDDGDFRESGLNKGDKVTFCTRLNFGNVFNKYQGIEVLEISEDEIALDMGTLTSLPNPPYSLYTVFISTANVSALIYDFGLIENDENFNTLNKVTQSLSSYYAAGISPNSTLAKKMDPRGLNKGWVSGESDIALVGTETDIGEPTSFDFDNVLVYKISHIFLINPWYLQGQLPQLEALVPPEDYEGNASYKYVFNAEFRRVLNDPNVIYPLRQENVLGSVAWFGESFNGFNSNYEIKSVNYFNDDTDDEADGIIYTGRTRVEIEVENTKEDFPSTTRFIPYFSFLPDEVEYFDTEESNMQENFMYDSILLFQSSANTKRSEFASNDIIKSGRCVFVSSRIQRVEIVTEFTQNQIERISQKRDLDEAKYLLAVQVGSSLDSAGNSTRATELVQIADFAEGPDIPGLALVKDFFVYPYPNTTTLGSGYTDMVSWNEDGLFATFKYEINNAKSAFINSISFALIAYNDVTKDYFILNQYDLDLSEAVSNGNGQEVFINTTRGYQLDSNDPFKKIVFSWIRPGAEVFPPAPLEQQFEKIEYYCQYAQKISWQDWIENLNVDPIFLEEGKPNNNRNLKSSNYSLKNDYTIRLAVISDLSGFNDEFSFGPSTEYLHLSPPIDVYDYGEDAEEIPEWTGEIKTFRASNNEDLDGLVLSTEDTIFQVTWTNKNGAVASLDELFAVNRIEKTDQEGFTIFELGTRENSDVVKILKPVDGESLLKMEIDSGNVVTTCLIDGSRVDENIGYNLSGRIGGAQEIVPPGEENGFDYVLDTPMN